MTTWDFVKMHGLGNDFVVVDERGRTPFPVASVPALCDRHTGIGADGVLVIGTASQPGAAARMDVWNADGSTAEMCGNGIRCVAARLVPRGTIAIQTGAGVLSCEVGTDGMVEVGMGPALLDGPIDDPRQVLGHRLRATRVRTGNPHLVTFDPVGEPDRRAVAAALAQDPAFPGGTNVELAAVEAGRIVLAVWERGVGFTRACGTGACATVAAACASERLAYDRPVVVSLPGGDLLVTVPGAGESIRMRGPAAEVFAGHVVIAGA